MRYLADVKGGIHAQYGATIGSIGPTNNDANTRRAAQVLNIKGEFGNMALLYGLLGAAPGPNVTYLYGEIAASSELGGVRPTVLTPLINRNSTAADVTDLKNALTYMTGLTSNPTPVYNGDRNPLGTR